MLVTLQERASLLMAQNGATGDPSGGNAFSQMAPLLLVAVVFYLMVIRPASKDRKQHAAMLEALKRGDEIVTSSGILGKITDMTDATVTLEVAAKVKIRVLRSSVAKKYVESKEAEPEGAKA